jgi:hypothetical protein
MAEQKNPFRIGAPQQESLVRYVKSKLEEHKKGEELRNKMTVIDIAYARYNQTRNSTDGVDEAAANYTCGVNLNEIKAPIVVAQADSFTGYLADVFLSGYPIFPIVSTPRYRKQAEKFQAIVDSHSIVGGYPRELLQFIRDGVKYNLSAIECDWVPIDKYSMNIDVKNPTGAAQAKKSQDHYTGLIYRDPYNLILDRRVPAAYVPLKGEYVGYIEVESRIQLMRYLQYLESTEYGYNTTSALGGRSRTTVPLPGTSGLYYYDRPEISKYISNRSFRNFMETDWEKWLNGMSQRQGRIVQGMYEKTTLYARIVPAEHGIMSVPNEQAPQIWKLQIVNNEKLICAKRVISAYDILPILIGQPMEDGFDLQTQSIAELNIPWQEAASTLFNIRFAAARRAVSDRALYDPAAIDSSDINKPVPAPKIPVKQGTLLTGQKTMDSIYKSIPFDGRGTEGVVADAGIIMNTFAPMTTGLNKPQQGEFQKGNKSVREWTDTMAGSDNRLRLPALTLEYQVFVPIKEQIKLNIFQYGPTGIFQNIKTGEPLEVTQADLEDLRKTVLMFKVADGYTPASKIAGTDVLKEGMLFLSQSPQLQATLGPALPNVWAHIMTLGGVTGIEEYLPENQLPVKEQLAQGRVMPPPIEPAQGAPVATSGAAVAA